MGIYVSKFEREFTDRTLTLLEEDDLVNHEYEVTLLINLCLGLITIPNEYSKNNKKTMERFLIDKYDGDKVRDVLSEKDVGEGFIKDGDGKYSDLKEVPYLSYLKKIRNAISHGRVELLGEDKVISFVKFSDSNGSNIELNIKELKGISKSIARVHLNFYDFVSAKGSM